MSLTYSLVVAFALAVLPVAGCKEKSNTTEQIQPTSLGPVTGTGASVGSETNANLPNPTHAPEGEEMGSAALQPGAANNPMAGDAGVGSAAGTGSGAGAGSAANTGDR